ncbi:hypothetical protein HN682_07925 [Candidatus Peregrinibacteria bacterium]|jgi:hypothetical protein|nr:hypothetical protein [Candidatus Peregrinibacteria bacterium]
MIKAINQWFKDRKERKESLERWQRLYDSEMKRIADIIDNDPEYKKAEFKHLFGMTPEQFEKEHPELKSKKEVTTI